LSPTSAPGSRSVAPQTRRTRSSPGGAVPGRPRPVDSLRRAGGAGDTVAHPGSVCRPRVDFIQCRTGRGSVQRAPAFRRITSPGYVPPLARPPERQMNVDVGVGRCWEFRQNPASFLSGPSRRKPQRHLPILPERYKFARPGRQGRVHFARRGLQSLAPWAKDNGVAEEYGCRAPGPGMRLATILHRGGASPLSHAPGAVHAMGGWHSVASEKNKMCR
jgi:hypothetical protein